jgi:CBS domain-containing protein
MNRAKIGALLVLKDKNLVGIFSERDVLTRVIGAGRDPAQTLIGEVMTRAPLTISGSSRLSDALRLMTNRHCRHLPVIQGTELAGMISLRDLNQVIIRGLEYEVESLSNYIGSTPPV